MMNKTVLTLKQLTLVWLNKLSRSHNQHGSATQVSPRCDPFLLVRLASTQTRGWSLLGLLPLNQGCAFRSWRFEVSCERS